MNTGEPFAQFLMNGVLPKNVDVVRYTGGVSHFASRRQACPARIQFQRTKFLPRNRV